VALARTGRRPGNGGTREAILDAARTEFARHGYGGTGIRPIARAAGVDPALIYHYFEDKQAIFVAALDFPFNPAEMIEAVLRLPREQAGESLIRTLTMLWDQEATRAPFLALVRSAVSSDQVAAMLREFFTEALIARVVEALGTPHAALRATLLGSQVTGLIMMRYIIKLEPLASLPTDQLVRAVAPNIQRYLAGDLGLPDEPSASAS
jgi:AcrR family transcriptional regulator